MYQTGPEPSMVQGGLLNPYLNPFPVVHGVGNPHGSGAWAFSIEV